MFVVVDPTHPRKPVEQFFSALYGIGVVLLFAALVITFDNFLYRIDQTYSDFTSGQSAVIFPNLEVLLAGCAANQTFKLGGLDVTAKIDATGSPFAFLSHALMVVGVIVVMFFIMINDLIAKGCFFTNVRHIRVRGLSLPINTLAANGLVVLSIALLCLIGFSSSGRSFLDNYIVHCTEQFAFNNRTEFIERENNVQTVFGINLNLCIIAVAINLFFYLAGFCAYCADGLSEASGKFEQGKYFFENPPEGVTSKMHLFHYTCWREFALECLREGVDLELRPVSYVEFMEDLDIAKMDYRSPSSGGGGRTRSAFDDPNNNHFYNHDNHVDGGINNNNNQQEELYDIPEAWNPDEIDPMDATDDGEDGGDFLDLDHEGEDEVHGNNQNNNHHHQPHHHNIRMTNHNHPAEELNDDYYNYDEDENADGAFSQGRNRIGGGADQPYENEQFRQQMLRKKADETDEERRERHRQRREIETSDERAARKERKQKIRDIVARTSSASYGARIGMQNINNTNKRQSQMLPAPTSRSSGGVGSGNEFSPSVQQPAGTNNNNNNNNNRIPPPAPSPTSQENSNNNNNNNRKSMAPPIPSP